MFVRLRDNPWWHRTKGPLYRLVPQVEGPALEFLDMRQTVVCGTTGNVAQLATQAPARLQCPLCRSKAD